MSKYEISMEDWDSLPESDECHEDDEYIYTGKFKNDDLESWVTYTMADALKERPPVEYVIEDLFAVPSLNVVHGASGTLKSMWLMDACGAVVSGNRFMASKDGLGLKTKKSPAAWLNIDNPLHVMHERFEAVCHTRKLKPDVPFYYWSFPNPTLDAFNFRQMQALQNKLQKHEIKLFVIDCLQAIRGVADENSVEMGTAMANLRQLSESVGCAIVLVHHANKLGGMRGSTAIENLVDLSLAVKRPISSNVIQVMPQKVRSGEVSPFDAKFLYTKNADGKTLHKFRFEMELTPEEHEDGELQGLVMKYVKENPGFPSTGAIKHLRLITGETRTSVENAIGQLVYKKKLRIEKGLKNANMLFIELDV